jgi:GH24 family phage-related lysozyme (muramidase)
MSDQRWLNNLDIVLIRDEGLYLEPYLDHLGNWTIAVGYLIGTNLRDFRISRDTAIFMLHERRQVAINDLIEIFGEDRFVSWSEARRVALVSMMYTLGINRFKGFHHMIFAIIAENWAEVAYQALDSKWRTDVDPKDIPGIGRDDRIAFMLKEGVYHAEYKIKLA